MKVNSIRYIFAQNSSTMRKKNKLYTANKWNQPLFIPRDKNLFALGDAMQQAGLESMRNNLVQGENLKGLDIKPTGGDGLNLSSGAVGALGGVANALTPMITKGISAGYDTGGVGEGIQSVGSAVGDVAMQFNPIIGMAVKLGTAGIGGLVNRTWGIKENAENIAAVKNNTAVAQNVGNSFKTATTTDDILDLSSNMTRSLGLSGDDLFKGGWAKSAKRKAGRKANKLTNLENAGLAYQTQGLVTGADNVEQTMNDNMARNFIFADGGYLPFDMISTPNTGAIDYGLKYDYLNMKNNQINAKNSNNIFAIGGEEDVWAGVPNRDLPPSVLLSRLEARRKAAQKPMPVPGVFGGGEFGGSGTTGRITEGRIPYEEEQRDTLWVPYTQTFEDAFRNARQQGLDEFTFDGKRYNTEMRDNPDNNAAARSRTVTDLLPLVLDRKSKKYKRVGLKAFGGDLATNASDFATGLTHIEAGGSHEENPYEGIQVGVDSEGVPNLVEEGETIFNDYVYSNRIEVPKEAQKWLGVKGKNLTFAEASKQLEEEIKERPNDPVSLASLKVQMERLEKEQEFVKRCTSYSVGEVYDVDNDEMSLLNHNGYEYEKLG